MSPKRGQFQELWVKAGDKALCALINGDRGWLMYLDEPGDSGFSSRNPAYDGPADATIEYYLDNGQRDEYPASWAYPIDEVMRALEYFRREEKRAPFVEWHRD
jgi:hypothetical protein